MPPSDLPSYVDWVIEQKPELRSAPEDVKKHLKEDLQQRLETLINTALLASVPAQELPYFEQLLDRGISEDTQKFLQDHIPNMDEVVAKVLVDFREQYLGAGE